MRPRDARRRGGEIGEDKIALRGGASDKMSGLYLLTHSRVYLITHSLTHALIYSHTRSFADSFTHSLTHVLIHLFT